MNVPIDDVIHFDAVTHNPTTLEVSDADSAPTYDVFEEATDTPILATQAMTKRTSLTGNYRGAITVSAANGFEAGKWYSVIVTAIVDGVTQKDVAKTFRVGPAESVAGVPKVDVSHLGGTAGTFAGGRPEVNVTHVNGNATSATAGVLNVGVASIANNAITTASIADGALTAAKFAAGAFDAVWSVAARTLTTISGLATEIRAALGLATNNLDTQLTGLGSGQTTINGNVLEVLSRLLDKDITTGSVAADGSNSTTTFKTNLTSSVNDHWKETFIQLTSGTMDGAIRKVDGYNGTTKFLTVTPAFPTTPTNGTTFAIINR